MRGRARGRLNCVMVPAVGLMALLLSACATKPLEPFTVDSPPLVLVPLSQAGVQDRRVRFREIFCAVLEARGNTVPDHRPCAEALTRLTDEPEVTGVPADLGPSQRRLIAAMVPGIGWDCFADWLDLKGSVAKHVRQFGYDQVFLEVDSLSSSANNARQIRDAILHMPLPEGERRLVLIGYSKGAPDILEAVVAYPEIHSRVAAVISVAGSIGGSPLANDAEQSQLNLLAHWPGAQCTPGDGGALESLRPATRKAWLAQHPLPAEIPFYSLVAYPRPERVSFVLKLSYHTLARIDARNDSQMLFYDQVIPGSTLLGYVNADHWAMAVPIARAHQALGATLVNHNDFPREALLEALLRFVEEDLQRLDR
jgi:dienelactone hydrolase